MLLDGSTYSVDVCYSCSIVLADLHKFNNQDKIHFRTIIHTESCLKDCELCTDYVSYSIRNKV